VSPQIVIGNDEIFDAHIGGKLSIEQKAPPDTQRALSIAYTPGVAQVSRAIAAAHTLSARSPSTVRPTSMSRRRQPDEGGFESRRRRLNTRSPSRRAWSAKPDGIAWEIAIGPLRSAFCRSVNCSVSSAFAKPRGR
jgi:hypothetical protein